MVPPEPSSGTIDGARVQVLREKRAPTVFMASTVTVQAPVPVQAPIQPVKAEAPVVALAVRVTVVPLT